MLPSTHSCTCPCPTEYGTGISGALFGLGWWFFIDAIVVAPVGTKIGFTKYLPGILSTIALVLINAVRLDEISEVDPFDDDGVYCRSRLWLLIAYCVCASSIAGATIVFLSSSATGIGLGSIIQVSCILGSALLFFVSRSDGDLGEGGGTYGLL